MTKLLLLLGIIVACVSVEGASLEFAFQLGVNQKPTVDRLLPHVARRMTFNEDGTKLIAKRMDGILVEWNIQTRAEQTLGDTEKKRWFAYAPKRNYLLIAKSNDDIVGLDVETHIEQPMMNGAYEVGALNDTASLVVLSQGDDKIELWYPNLAQLVGANKVSLEDSSGTNVPQAPFRKREIFSTSAPVRNGLTLSPSGRYIAAAEGTYRDGEGHRTLIEVWDVKRGHIPIWVFNTGEILGVWNLVFSQDETMLAVDTQHNNKSGIRVWNIHTGAQILTKNGFDAYWNRAIAFAPKLDKITIDSLVSGDEAGNLQVWNLSQGESVIWETYPTGIQALAFSPSDNYLAVALWDATIQILRWRKNSEQSKHVK